MHHFKKYTLLTLSCVAYYTGTAQRAVEARVHEIPVLCYHQVRDWKPDDSKSSRTYIIPPSRFKEQMKILLDSGYHAVLPEQVFNYFENAGELPGKPVMITFDDACESQYTQALPVLNSLSFKLFFLL